MKILFLAANPQSTSRLNLEKEAREIQESLDISELAREFELIQKWEVRARDFRRALLRYQPDIVHFSGHGEGESGLVIVDELSGASKAVTGEALAGLFAEFPCVQCVLLNACYAEVQAQAIVSHVDYVIGMRETIYDKAAIAFAIGFYDGLGYGRSVEEAFRLGSNAILWEYKNNTGQTRAMIPVESVQVESSEQLPEHLKPILLKKAKNVVEGINNQPQRREPLVANSNSREKYRTRIQKYLTERNLTPIAKWQLATFAKEQGISESEASRILEAELAKIEQAKETYGNLLRETMAKGFNPLEARTQQQLKELQQVLKLWDEEVEAIYEVVLAETEAGKKEAEARKQEEYERKLERYEQEFFKAVGGSYPLDEYVRNGLKTFQDSLGLRDEDVERIEKPIVEQKEAEAWKRKEEERIRQQQELEKKQEVTKYVSESLVTPTLQAFEFELVTVNIQRKWWGLGSGIKFNRSYTQAQYFTEDLGNGVELDMVSIPGGKFMMGSAGGEGYNPEKPQHEITVQPFFMAKFQVTQAQWREIASLPRVKRDLNPKPSEFKGDNLPVERVSWDEAEEFCQRLSKHTGKEYSLPSEAEWEYACRAGTITTFHFGEKITNKLANYESARTKPVGSFPPNAFGLYDMHGNVWEWCEDDWHDNYNGAPTDGSAWRSVLGGDTKVIRGGSWYDHQWNCRSAVRDFYPRNFRNRPFGLRVACVAPRTT
ncbi:MAG: SUMF1/EgtB/PvdO family nonheme iron enzyme [Xenococcaceae cyanobacterium]